MLALLEIVAVFSLAIGTVFFLLPYAGDDPLLRQAVVWIANIVMILAILVGMQWRGEPLTRFGLELSHLRGRALLGTLWKSLVVFFAGTAAFILGSVIMGMIVGRPEPADMSSYEYMQGNLPMLLLALAAVYVVSSFGEEFVYRGFLINRLAEAGGGGKTATRVAVVASGIVFGAVHYDWGAMGIAQTTFMGLAFGICYLVFKRNLWALVLAHAYMDTALLVQMYMGGG